MNIEQFVEMLGGRGVSLQRAGDDIRRRNKRGAITPDETNRIKNNKDEILNYLDRRMVRTSCSVSTQLNRENSIGGRPTVACPIKPRDPLVLKPKSAYLRKSQSMSVPPPIKKGLTVGDMTVWYTASWQGEVMTGEVIAFDTETTLIEDPKVVPTMALASASSGTDHCLIHPDNVGDFFVVHQDHEFVFHNVAFDFWVLVEHFTRRKEVDALRCWWKIKNDDRLHDTMILDMLVRLAENDDYPRQRSLDIIASA